MNITYDDVTQEIKLEGLKDFDLVQILTCGQCFRWHEVSKNYYRGVVANKVVDIEQTEESTVLVKRIDLVFFENYLYRYFDLGRDYGAIKAELIKKDDVVKKAISYGQGIRILNQDPFEMLLTFIISGNNNIPRITKAIGAISMAYGTLLETIDGKAYYAFPRPDQLKSVSVEDFRKLGVGYRDKYLYDAVSAVLDQRIDLQALRVEEYKTLKTELMKVKGVGSKVADCIILFAYEHKSAFPVDTWVKKIITSFYDATLKRDRDILQFADEHFGAYAGVAQQYLFYYARKMKI
jgi:N-glycosylase/DNA lyase